jgi:hypothetical protein
MAGDIKQFSENMLNKALLETQQRQQEVLKSTPTNE